MKTIDSARTIFQNLAKLSAEKRELFECLLKQQGEDLTQLPIPLREASDTIPLSYPQERVWTISQLTPDSSVDNVPVGFHISGAFNVKVFEQSLRALIQRNEVLRTHCTLQDQQVTQSVRTSVEPWTQVINLCDLPETHRLELAVGQATEIAQTPFDLKQDLLLRATVFCLGEQDFVVLLVVHQLVTDGLSFRFLLQELAELYNANLTGVPPVLPEISVQYADFSIWQRQWFTDSLFTPQLSYWKEKLQGAPSQLKLPISSIRQQSTHKGSSESFKFSAEKSDQFRQLCREQGVTVFMAFVTLFQIVLQRCSGQDDISIGTLISSRNRRETEKLIGNFSNNLLLRTKFTDEMTFCDLLMQVKDQTLEAYSHQDLPFQYLFERLKNVPKFQVLILLRNSTIAQSFDLIGLEVQNLDIDLGSTRMEMNLDITDDAKNPIFGKLEYKTDLFEMIVIQQMLQNLQALLVCVVEDPNQKLIDIALPEEIHPSQWDNAIQPDQEDRKQAPDGDRSFTETQAAIAEIWSDILGVAQVGLHDNFFELGGHSLLAVKLFASIEQRLGKKLPLSILFQAPTILELDSVINSNETQVSWSPLVRIQVGNPQKIPLFCMHGGGFNVLIYRDLALKLDPSQPVYGLQARGLDGTQPLHQRFESIATDYLREVQTIQPEGPYLLAGLSNGGNLAFEMAQQLHAQGQKAILLAMFDTYGPDSVKLLPPIARSLSALHYLLQYMLPNYLVKIWASDPKTWLDQSWTLWTKLWRKVYLSQGSSKNPNAQSERHNNRNTKSKSRKTESFFSEVRLQKESPMFADPVQIKLPNTFEKILNQFSSYILQHSPWAFFTPSNQLQEMDDTVSTTLKNLEEYYKEVIKTYAPQPYPGHITLFKAKEFPPGMLLDSQLGWASIARGGVKVYTIPGHHTSILEQQELADKLQACIDEAQQSVL